MASTLKYLSNATIDKSRWDRCIAGSDNGLVYAKSYYLDHTAPGWDALVKGDYEAVMPLPLRRKLGVAYLFQAPFTPVLGVFGKNVSPALVAEFLQALPRTLIHWDYSFNHFNWVNPARYPLYQRENFVLPLKNSYEQIRIGYQENTVRNLRKASSVGCSLQRDLPIDTVIAMAQEKFAAFSKLSASFWATLPALISDARHRYKTYGITDREGNLLATAVFILDERRAYYWLVGNAAAAREANASFLLIDAFIQDHAGMDLLLDFEGSDVPGIAAFYRKFGASPEPFTTIYYNRFAWLLNLFKKVPATYKRIQPAGS